MDKQPVPPQSTLDMALQFGAQACGQLFEQSCCNKLINELDYKDPVCMSIFATKAIGYAIVFGASLVKLPQVLKIYNAKSGAGLAIMGVLLELLAVTFNLSYSYRNNFPFSAWGEAVFLAIETVLIAFMVLWFDGSKGTAFLFLGLYSSMIYSLATPTIVKHSYLWYLQSSVLYLAVGGKLLQALKNFKAQHTGQLSAVSACAIFGGSVLRIFTTIKETGDMLTAVTFMAAASANFVLVAQVFYYWSSTTKFLNKAQIKKKQ